MNIRAYLTYLLAFLLAMLTCSDCYGQMSDSLTYQIDLQIGGQRKTGVFSQTSLRVLATNQLERRKLALNNVSAYTYTNVNSMTIADDWDFKSILMYRSHSHARLLPAIAHNFHSNVLYRIVRSNRVIAGIRTIPFKKIPAFTFLLGAGYERSNYAGDIFLNSPYVSDQRSFAVGFANLSGKHILGKHNMLFQYNFSFVQSIREVKDYFLWLTAGIGLPIGKVFSIGMNYDLRYRNVHLKEIPQVNDLLLINLSVSLSN